MIKAFSYINRLIAATFGCFFLFACENSEKEIQALTKRKKMVDEVYNIESYLSQDGILKARLTAPLMLRHIGADTLKMDFPKTLHCDFYNDSAIIETVLDSKFGVYYESLNKVYIWDSVVVITTKGDTLRTEDLWWDQNTKLFYTDKPAVYTKANGDILLPENGLEATQDFKRVTFRQVEGILHMESGGMPE